MANELSQFEARAYHCGIESKTDSKIIDELEKCLGI